MSDDYYDSLEKYGVDNKKDIMIPYLFSSQELDYKDREVTGDVTNTHHVAVEFDKRYVNKVMNRISFYHFHNLKKYIPLLKSREQFLGENWLNLYNRTVYAIVPRSMTKDDLRPNEKLKILEAYFMDVAKKLKQAITNVVARINLSAIQSRSISRTIENEFLITIRQES
ncbi:hypothetical protein P5G51_015100 [Virgibacillus sp. 179-BFC.A HS]|uniref:Uncharacterized protein n=1 Tax=Tigheibacillus jepli TaxID=3035914 RepID=A0ABU5CJN6_9BACI|nr:hypothetical protein [Virgibacillus sp. 179-BFC.A HS]MDY0406515.1 hypothetical protein [Virgibacillus sp. 179-BFC.A HS]